MKRFNMIDENFICENCGKEITKLGYTARDHCNYCLYSKHVDILPGDRKNMCQGLLKPIGIEKFKEMKLLAPGDTVVISGNEKGKEDRHAYMVSFVLKVK